MNITRVTLRNRHAVWALVLAAAVFGGRAYLSIPMQLFPDTAPPLVNVLTAYPGASATDVDENLSQKLESEFASLEGVARIRTTSQDNLSVVSVEFQYGRDVDLAAVDVQNAIARIRNELPRGILEPRVLKFSTSDRPVVSIGVMAADLDRARKAAEERFAPELQRLAGVAAVDVFGGHKPALLVEVSRRKLEAYRIPLPKLVAAIRSHNDDRPAGLVRTETTQTMFRLEARARSVEEIRRIPIDLPDGSRVLLGSLARIRQGSLDDDSLFAVRGEAAIALQVFKTTDANTVEVVRRVQEKLAELGERYPDYRFVVGDESASFAEISVNNLLDNVWQALAFASLIIFLFLGRIGPSLVTILSMPLSYALTFAAMYAFDVEFNMVTLSAVILAVGMVVDASVVILENIVRKRDAEGLSPEEAAIQGTQEVQLAVLAGVATTLVVLVPLLFLQGFIGKTFGPLALTLIFAFTSSIVVALGLVPVLTLRATRRSKLDRLGEALVWPFQWAMERLRRGYVGLLSVALRHKVATLLVTVALLAGSVVGLRRRGMEVLPKMDGGSFFISIQTPSGSSLEETQKVVRDVERILRGIPEVKNFQSQMGFEQGMRSLSAFGVQGPTQASITVTLTERTRRSRSIWEIEDEVRARIAKVPGIRTSVVRELGNTAKSTTSAPVVVRITGEDPLVLDRLGDEVLQRLSKVRNIVEPTRAWRFDQKQVKVFVDRLRVGQLGLTPDAVAATMAMGSYGVKVGEFYGVEGKPDPILVRYDPESRASARDLLDYPLFVPNAPAPVPLRAVARAVTARVQGVVTREDLAPTLEVSAFTEGRPLNFVIQDVERALGGMRLPRGYRLELTGEKSDLAEARSELLSAFLVALVAVYLLLVAQLRSFLHPLTIMTSIPLSLIGVSAALWIAGKPVSMPVMVGLILLVGTVVNNAIILIDFIRQRRLAGADRRDALLGSVETRFRPIMMTSLSTIVGMIPLAAEWALGAERFSPLATAVIGGMTAATFLTMVIVPVLYDLFEGWKEFLQRIFRPSARSSRSA